MNAPVQAAAGLKNTGDASWTVKPLICHRFEVPIFRIHPVASIINRIEQPLNSLQLKQIQLF
jgi:hypothetical protein